VPSAGEFEVDYVAALRDHLTEPGETGLQAAYDLGRRALTDDISMLEIVGWHHELLEKVDGAAPRYIVDANEFLREVLAAFEISQRGYGDAQRLAQVEQGRVELLHGMTGAYLAVVAAVGLDERVEAVEAQARSLLGAAEARLVLGVDREQRDGPGDQPGVITVDLPGGAGRLTAVADPGRAWTESDRATLEQLAMLVNGPVNDARLLALSARLERLGSLLADAADPATVIDRLLQQGLQETGAVRGAVYSVDGDVLRDVGSTSEGRLAPRGDIPLGDGSPLTTVASTGEPAFLGTPEEIEAYVAAPRRRARAEQAWALVPVQTAGGRAGVFAMEFDEPQSFDAAQRSFLAQVGSRVATALERGRIHERERAARVEAQESAIRLGELQRLAADLAGAATRRRVAEVLLRHLTATTGASGGFVATVRPRVRQIDVLAARGVLAASQVWSEPEALGPVRAVLDLGEPVEMCTFGEIEARCPSLAEELGELGIQCLGLYPVSVRRRRVGAAVVAWSDPGSLGNVNRDVLAAQLAMAGPALQRATQFDVEHEIAETLQSNLLTIPATDRPWVPLAMRYRAGSASRAGGDWYDVIELDEDRLALAVGDIVGRGVPAAASMGQLRSATRALAPMVDDPGELLVALDQYVATTGQGMHSTIAYVVVDTRHELLRHALAGHPPPVLRMPDGTTHLLDAGHGPLLGMNAARHSATTPITPGALLVLYTDGLIERRGEPVDVGLARLTSLVAEQSADTEPDQLAKLLIDAFEPATDDADDIAILTLAYRPG
jgi:Stage II sporulation protein E (SpoIIE)/Phosphoserine phosphatase RsbU, N-terminal domain/GAF domain